MYVSSLHALTTMYASHPCMSGCRKYPFTPGVILRPLRFGLGASKNAVGGWETFWEVSKCSGGPNALGASKGLHEAQKRSGRFLKALGGSETFWKLQKRSGRFRNALGASKWFWEAQQRSESFKKLWEAKKRSGILKKALGGSETFWELQKSFGRFSTKTASSSPPMFLMYCQMSPQCIPPNSLGIIFCMSSLYASSPHVVTVYHHDRQ